MIVKSANEAESLPSIVKNDIAKNTKKPNNDFAKFLQDLGKTTPTNTKAKKSAEKSPNSITKPSNEAQKVSYKPQNPIIKTEFSQNPPTQNSDIAKNPPQIQNENNADMLKTLLQKNSPSDTQKSKNPIPTPKIAGKNTIDSAPSTESKIESKAKSKTESKAESKINNTSDTPPIISQDSPKDSPKENNIPPQALPQNPTQEKNTNNIKLPFKDTLKYATFKAFDALSLLKPSDGKKISDLIKKADELALNLQKMSFHSPNLKIPSKDEVKNEKLADLDLKNTSLKNHIDNAPKSDILENLSPKMTQDEATPLVKNQKMADTSKVSQDSPKDSIKDSATKDSPKDSPKDSTSKDLNQNILKDILSDKTEPKSPKETTLSKEQNLASSNLEESKNFDKTSDLKPINFKPNEKKESKETSGENKQQTFEKALDSIAHTKIDSTQKGYEPKEVIRSFTRQLRQEIIDYKPPLSKITLELNPASLGNVEVSITHQGKNIQVQLNANQNVINLFIQNQSDLRAALNQIGYENITMSFSNGSQMGFSDSKGNWSYHNENITTSNFSDDSQDNADMANLEITLVNNYA